MATGSLSLDKAAYRVGDPVVLSPSLTGLDPGVPDEVRQAVGHATWTLDDGTVLEVDSQQATITKPGRPAQAVVSLAVTFDGRTATRRADGKYTITA